MNRVLALLALFLAAAEARPNSQNLDSYSFEQYLQDFSLKYSDSELPQRRSLFDAEIQRLKAHNAKNLGWKEGVSKFTVMTPAEKKAYFGHSKELGKSHKKNSLKAAQSLPSDFKMKPLNELPKSVDWRDSGIVSPVKDQGHCGSCWAFASTATIESHVAKASGLLFDLSVQQVTISLNNSSTCFLTW